MIDAAFQPKWASPPGETISDLLSEKHKSAYELAKTFDLTAHETYLLLSGISKITRKIAGQLSDMLGGSPEFWLERERQFRFDLQRLPIEHLYDPSWLASIPLNELVRLGWIHERSSEEDQAKEVLEFFGVQSSAQWHLMYSQAVFNRAFRKSPSFESNNEAIAAWMRQGERIGGAIQTNKWNPKKFNQALQDIRRLTRSKYPSRFIPALRRACAECGVALVVARTPTGCPASGATEFLSRDKAVILLSFRYRSDDQFWFSFFHEAGHLLLHDMDDVFIDEYSRGSGDSQYEKEANEFAANTLVPSENREEMLALSNRYNDVLRFAVRYGVSPGIVVGQLQHVKRLERNQLNRLKRYYDKKEIDLVLSP